MFAKRLLWFALAWGPVMVSNAEPTLDAQYNEAYLLETGERNVDAAITAYTTVVAKGSSTHVDVLRAHYRRGLCYEKLGQDALAMQDYRVVVSGHAPADIRSAATSRLADLELTQAEASARRAQAVPADKVLASLAWLTHWSLALSPGVSVPIGNSIFGGTLHRSASLGVQGLYRVNDTVQAGLEFAYSFGHSLDFPPPLQIQDAQASSYRLKVLQLTPVAEVGHDFKSHYGIVRPYAIGGLGFYELNQVAFYQSGNLKVTTSDSDNYAGINGGVGLAYRATPYLAIGPEARYHQVFASVHNLHTLVLSFRIALLL